jgi:uncharacterized membrane protein
MQHNEVRNYFLYCIPFHTCQMLELSLLLPILHLLCIRGLSLLNTQAVVLWGNWSELQICWILSEELAEVSYKYAGYCLRNWPKWVRNMLDIVWGTGRSELQICWILSEELAKVRYKYAGYCLRNWPKWVTNMLDIVWGTGRSELQICWILSEELAQDQRAVYLGFNLAAHWDWNLSLNGM